MGNEQFDNKWGAILEKSGDEFSLYVPKGEKPKTQRRFNLFHYYQYIKTFLPENAKVLEIGCGRGTIGLYMAKDGHEVSLIDVEQSAIDLAKKNFDFHKEAASFHVGDSEDMPFEDSTFDAVVSIGLHEHLEDYSGLFREELRVLKPGGAMVALNLPKKFSVQKVNLINRGLHRLFGMGRRVKKDYYRNTHKPKQYRKTAHDVGFSKVKTIMVNPFPIITPLPYKLEYPLALLYRAIYALRSTVMSYPMKTNKVLAHGHFISAYKPKDADGKDQ